MSMGNPPSRLRLATGPTFAFSNLKAESHSHGYLVQLLTFHQTLDGSLYYKTGKAKSMQKRIKQFGPCSFVASINLQTEHASLEAGSKLHGIFAHLCSPETEIFCLNGIELQAVVAKYLRYKRGDFEYSLCQRHQLTSRYRRRE